MLFILSIDYRRNNLNTYFEWVVFFLRALVKKKFGSFRSHLVHVSETPCLSEMELASDQEEAIKITKEGTYAHWRVVRPVVTCAHLIISLKRCRGQPRSFMLQRISLAKGTKKKWNQDEWVGPLYSSLRRFAIGLEPILFDSCLERNIGVFF